MNVYPHSFPVTLEFLELSCAKASKRHQKSRWEFDLENTNHIKMDDLKFKKVKIDILLDSIQRKIHLYSVKR